MERLSFRIGVLLNNDHLPKRLASAVIGAFIFSFAFWGISQTYYGFIDQTQYVIVDSPVNVDKPVYKPCEESILTTQLTSLIDVQAIIVNQLVLVRQDGSQFQVLNSLVEIRTPIQRQATHQVSSPYKLPCTLDDGTYYWKGSISYQIRGFERTAPFISQTFRVSKTGLSSTGQQAIEDAVREATASAH